AKAQSRSAPLRIIIGRTATSAGNKTGSRRDQRCWTSPARGDTSSKASTSSPSTHRCSHPVMERAPHFHLWLVPKKDAGELRGVAYLAQQPPLTSSYSEAEAMSRKIAEQFEQSCRVPRRALRRVEESAG